MTAPTIPTDSPPMASNDSPENSIDLEFSDLHVGRRAEFNVSVSEESLDRFAALSGDVSAVHVSKEAAEARGFSDRVGHGMLAGAYISRLIGTRLPGNRALLQSMNLRFHRPFFPGDLLGVEGKISEVHESVHVVLIDVRITRDGELVVSAKAQVGVAP
jgi:acyl dehydratase